MENKVLDLDSIVNSIQNTKPSDYIKNTSYSDINEYLQSPHFKTDNDPLVKAPETGVLDPFWEQEFKGVNQSSADQLANGVAKFVGKVGLYTVGNLAGAVYGIPSAIYNQDFTKFYNNEFTKVLDNIEEGMNEALPNYMTTKQQEYGLLRSLGTANFWANDFLGGMAFTVSAVLSETIASTITAATLGAGATAQAGLTARLLSKATKSVNNLTKTSRLADTSLDALKTVGKLENGLYQGGTRIRQLITGAGYEAGVEARHFINESEKSFIDNYKANHKGKEPSPEEIAEYMSNVHTTANYLFAGNVALVGGGNILTLPKTFGPGLKVSVPGVDKLKSLVDPKNIVREGANTPWKVAYDNWSKAAKVAYGVGNTSKRFLYEGLVEEGGQGLMNKAALNYMAKHYSADGVDVSYTMWDSLNDAFSETYGDPANKEFRKEVMLGMLIGGVGAPTFRRKGGVWQGSVLQSYRETRKDLDEARSFIDEINKKQLTPLLAASVKQNNIIFETNKDMDEAQNRGDMFSMKNAENDQLFSIIYDRHKLSKMDSLKEDVLDSIGNMPNEEFAETFGYNNMTDEELSERKNKVIKSFQDKVDSTKESIKTAEGIVGSKSLYGETKFLNNDDLKQALAYNIESVKNLDNRERTLSRELEELIGISTDKIISAAKLDFRFSSKDNWMKNHYLPKLKKLEKEVAKYERYLSMSSRPESIQKHADNIYYADNKVDAAQNKVFEVQAEIDKLVQDKVKLEKYSDFEYGYDIDSFKESLDSLTGFKKVVEDTYKTKPYLSEEIDNSYKDLAKIAAQRENFNKEIQALMSREGAMLFSDDLQKIKEDSWKITKDTLVSRYKADLKSIAAERKDVELATAIVEDEIAQEGPVEIQRVPDIGNEQFDTIKNNFYTKEDEYEKGPKNLVNSKSRVSALKNIKQSAETAKEKEESQEIKAEYEALISNIEASLEVANEQYNKFLASSKLGDEPILNRAEGLLRLIIFDDKKVDTILKDATLQDKKDYLSIRKAPYDDRDNTTPEDYITTPKSSYSGMDLDTSIKMKLGDGQGNGYFLYYGEEVIGGITHPDRFLYNDRPLDPNNDSELIELGLQKEDFAKFRAYHDKASKLFKNVDTKGRVNGEEIMDLFKIYQSTPGFTPIGNSDTRDILNTFFTDNPEYHSEVNGKKGIIVIKGLTSTYLYDGKESINVTDEPEAIAIVSAAKKKTNLSKLRHQYAAIVPVQDDYVTLGLDYPASSEYTDEELNDEINSLMDELNNLSEEELLKELETNKFIFRNTKLFITVQDKERSTSKITLDATVQRNYSKKNKTFGDPYFVIKASETTSGSENYWFQYMVKRVDGKLFVTYYVWDAGESIKQEVPLTKESFLKAFNKRIQGYNKTKDRTESLVPLFFKDDKVRVTAKNIKRRSEVENIGELELAALPRKSKSGNKYYLEANYKIFEDTTEYEKSVIKEEIKKESEKAELDIFGRPKTVIILPLVPDVSPDGYTMGQYYPEKGGYAVRVQNGKAFFEEKDIAMINVLSKLEHGNSPLGQKGVNYNRKMLEALGISVNEAGTVFTLPNGAVVTIGEDVKPQPPAVQSTSSIELTSSTPAKQANVPLEKTEVVNVKDLFTRSQVKKSDKPQDDESIKYSFNAYDGTKKSNLVESRELLLKILPIKSETNPDGLIDIKEIGELSEAIKANGMTFGAFHDAVIYLSNNRATKGVVYHEAFHSVFRVLTTEESRKELLKEAKDKYSEGMTIASLNNLRAKHPNYSTLSNSELEELWLEEKLADEFAKYATSKPTSRIGRFFDKIRTWIEALLKSNKTLLKGYFDGILSGQYTNATSLYPNSKPVAFALLNTVYDTDRLEGSIPPRSKLTRLETSRIISRVAMALHRNIDGSIEYTEEDINEAIEEVKEFYSPDNFMDDAESYVHQGNPILAIHLSDKIRDIGSALEHKDNLPIIKNEVVKIMSAVNAEAYYEESEDLDSPESSFDKNIGEDSGFKTLTQKIKAFLLTTTYQENEFGIGLTQEDVEATKHSVPINVYKTYYNIQKALVGTTADKMLDRLKYLGKYDDQVQAVYVRLISTIREEIKSDKKELSLAEISKSNTFNAFLTNFNRTRLDIRDVLYDMSQGTFKIISANQKDASRTQFLNWAENYNTVKKSPTEVADAIIDLKASYYLKPESLITNIDENAEYIKKELMDNLGMDLHPAYIKWSIINDNLEKLEGLQLKYSQLAERSPLEDVLNDLMSFHNAYNTGINSLNQKISDKKSGEEIGLLFGLIPSTSVLANTVGNQNPYGLMDIDVVEVEGSREKSYSGGVRTRLFNIAAANAMFDPTVRPTSYQNIEGKNIWDVVHHSFYSTMHDMFKTPEFKAYLADTKKGQSTWQDLRDVLKEYDTVYNDHFLQIYHNSISSNPLVLTSNIEELLSVNSILSTIGGMRNAEIDSEGKLNTNKDFNYGKTWKHLDAKSKLVIGMSYFAQDITRGDSTFARYNYNVNEGKATTFLVELPKLNMVSRDTSLTAIAKSNLNSLFIGEVSRIRNEYNNIEKVRQGKLDKNEGWNYDSKTNSYTTKIVNGQEVPLRAFDLNIFKWVQDIDPSMYEYILKIAKDTTSKLDFEDLEERMSVMYDVYFDKLNNEFIDLLKDDSIRLAYTDKEGELKVSGLPDYYKDGNNLDVARLKDFLVNDYVQTVSYNNLLDGDTAYGKKDFIDYVKRNAGKIAYGPSMGTGQTNYAVIESFKDERTSADHTDAQSYATEAWMYNTYFRSLGKLANTRVKEILKKKRMGYLLNPEEIRILNSNKAMGQAKKLVGKDQVTYLKTSVSEIQRSAVSYVPAGQRSMLDAYYKELFEAEEEGDIEAISRYNSIINDIWKPLPNREKQHSMLKNMETNRIDIISFDSAIKEAKLNVSKFDADGKIKLIPNVLNNKYLREQVITDGEKNKIVHGTQLIQLIWSEQNPNTEVEINGKTHKLEKLQEVYKNLIAERIRSGRLKLENTIFEKSTDGKLTEPKYDKLYKSFIASQEKTNPNPYLVELFSTDINGNPVYDPNFTGVSAKFYQMFLAYASNDVLKHKVKGIKYTLQSDFGYEVLVDKDNKIVRTDTIRKYNGLVDEKLLKSYKTRKLEYNEETGEAEAIISANVAKLYNLKPGDEIPANVAKQLGFRIPTQDKHSMIKLKVVDLLPASTMNTIMVHPKVIELSGADFDIDSLFARLYETFNSHKNKFGDYLLSGSIEDAVKEIRRSKEVSKKLGEFIRATKFRDRNSIIKSLEEGEYTEEELDAIIKDEKNKDLNKAIEQFYINEKLFSNPLELKNNNPELYQKIKSNISAFEAGKMEFIEPITLEETNNMLLDIEYEFINNGKKGNKEIAETPASFKAIDQVLELWKNNGLDYSIQSNRSHDIISKFNSIRANDAGNGGIGPAALANVAFQNLIAHGAEVDPDNGILGKSKFSSFKEGVNRINDSLSTLISAMTDNAKLLFSSQLNLNINTIGLASVLFGLGINSNIVFSILRQKAFTNFNNMLERKSSAIISEGAVRKLRGFLKNSDNFIEEFLKSEGTNLTREEIAKSKVTTSEETLIEALKYEKGLENTLSEADYLKIQLETILNIFKARDIADEIRSYTKVLSLIKGFSADPSKVDSIFETLDDLGIHVKGDINNVSFKFDKTQRTKLNWKDIVLANPYVRENIISAFKIRKYLGKFLIAYSDMGQKLINSIKANSEYSKVSYGDDYAKLLRNVSSYLMLRMERIRKGGNIYKAENLFKPDFINRFKELRKEAFTDITSPLYGNMFLKSLNTYSKESKGMFTYEVRVNTRTLTSPDVAAEVLDAFKVLYVNPKYRDLAGQLVDHLAIKDGMEYRNGSYLSNIDPSFLSNMIDGLKQVKQAFNTNDPAQIKKLLNIDLSTMKKELVELYLLDSNNTRDRKINSSNQVRAAANEAMLLIAEKNRAILPTSTKDKRNKVMADMKSKPSLNPIFLSHDEKRNLTSLKISSKPGVKFKNFYSEANKESEIKYMSSLISTLTENTFLTSSVMTLPLSKNAEKGTKPTVVEALGFPLVVNFRDITYENNGEVKKSTTKVYTLRLKAVNRSRNEDGWEEPTIEDSNYVVSGYEAIYEPINDVNRGLFSLMGVDLEETIAFMDNYKYEPTTVVNEADDYIDLDEAASYMKAINDAQRIKDLEAIKASGRTLEQVIAENKAKHTNGLLNFDNLKKDNGDKKDCE